MSVAGLTDSHCHLNHAQFDLDRDEVIERARLAGVTRLLVIGYDRASSRFALELARKHLDIQAVVGIHPDSIGEWSPEAANELCSLVSNNRANVAAWGEIGLDYYYSDGPPHHEQLRAFEQQLACAAELDLPAVIHCRDAYDDVVDSLGRMHFSRGVLHCFTGTEHQARRAIAAGLHIGVGGIATFKKSEELRAVIASLPLERIVIETDCPYLAPQPWRGKRNEPAYVLAVAEMLAGLSSRAIDEIAAITTANAESLFGRMDK